MKQHIPNTITSLNLLSGCLAILEIANGNLINASLFILLGAFFDLLDGMVARLLKVHSKLGAELDSLADVVTFGVVPAYMAFSILQTFEIPFLLPYLAFSLTIFSAVRLAKFNLDNRQTDGFIGLPTPANALFWLSLPLIQWQIEENYTLFSIHILEEILFNPWILILIILLFSYLMVSGIPLMSFKIKSLKFSDNRHLFLFLVVCLILILLMYFAAIPFILLLYFTFSFVKYTTSPS